MLDGIKFNNNDIKTLNSIRSEHLSEVFHTIVICTKPNLTSVGGLYSLETLTNEVIVGSYYSHFGLHFCDASLLSKSQDLNPE